MISGFLGKSGLLVACGSACTQDSVISTDADWGIAGTIGLFDTGGPPSLVEVEMLLDGRQVSSIARSEPQSVLYASVPEQRIGSGNHIVILRLVRQFAQARIYQVIGAIAIVNPQTNEARSEDVNRTKVMAAGDTIAVRVVVP